jgi:hypothetical protein
MKGLELNPVHSVIKMRNRRENIQRKLIYERDRGGGRERER